MSKDKDMKTALTLVIFLCISGCAAIQSNIKSGGEIYEIDLGSAPVVDKIYEVPNFHLVLLDVRFDTRIFTVRPLHKSLMIKKAKINTVYSFPSDDEKYTILFWWSLRRVENRSHAILYFQPKSGAEI